MIFIKSSTDNAIREDMAGKVRVLKGDAGTRIRPGKHKQTNCTLHLFTTTQTMATTSSRQSLGKRTRSSYVISSSPPVSPVAPSPSNKRPKTVSFTLTNSDDPNANKENIPPLPDFLEALSARDLRAKARRSSSISSTSSSRTVSMRLSTGVL